MREQLKNKQIMLAPLAGVSDVGFRLIAEKYGADKTFTEMVSVNALYYDNKKTDDLLFISENEKNCNIQIFGSKPDIIEKVVKDKINPIEKSKEISFNMGCPVAKITKNGEGSALMAKPKLVEDICKTLRKSTDKKINIKFRLGIDGKNLNYLEIGKIAQDAGIDYVILHARTKEQMYSGKADWNHIKILKENLSIPVIANGDIFCVEDFVKVIDKTKADGVMLARGAMGNPFLFKEIKDYINKGFYEKPSSKQIIDQLIEQYKLELKYKKEKLVVTQMRKHLSWYIKGLKNSSKIRDLVNKLNTIEEVMDALEKYKSTLKG
ncbi:MULTISPECIES: tRNA dihydrouridine synthase DusB [Anaerococcus]|uniref:tRNA dihydrouridine synthase DusB n=1 Tax=Anaerococcus TaxID=165779 RepID=UPI000316B093|nr:tRNA dihydrouridine synthase DusB [Anaerococcus vaginalis]MDU0946463.1 tRNA dihydrouridine synthase DusB [Anaerococcus vaginalis]MDU1030628.1 tRNA dihydrouridine synthase DusB [Anaerococcus vaginalis]MDU5251866.1 tRNA dihydrouridine synthase DusB [Anaerococcus vaginalis]MDU6781371.1 tRNA dihydrouridine synthase DusB [Anaerococcus vaginalis]